MLFLLSDQQGLPGEAQAWTQGLCPERCGLQWPEQVGNSGAWLQRTSQDHCDLP